MVSGKSLVMAKGRFSRSTLVERNALSKVCDIKLAKGTYDAKLDRATFVVSRYVFRESVQFGQRVFRSRSTLVERNDHGVLITSHACRIVSLSLDACRAKHIASIAKDRKGHPRPTVRVCSRLSPVNRNLSPIY